MRGALSLPSGVGGQGVRFMRGEAQKESPARGGAFRNQSFEKDQKERWMRSVERHSSALPE
jgi:hypothetical protein